MLHAVLLEVVRLHHLQPPEEHADGGDDTESEREAPDCAEVVEPEDPEEDEGDECGDDEAGVDHGVCVRRRTIIMVRLERRSHNERDD